MEGYKYTYAYNFLQRTQNASFLSVVAFHGHGSSAVISSPRYMRSTNTCARGGGGRHALEVTTDPARPPQRPDPPLLTPPAPAPPPSCSRRTLTTGTGRASQLFLIVRLSAGNPKYLQWFSLGCGDCGVATDLCMSVGGGDTTCGQSETKCSALSEGFDVEDGLNITDLTSLTNRTKPPLVSRNSSVVRVCSPRRHPPPPPPRLFALRASAQ